MSTLSLIVAYSDNHVIGIDNDLPWRLKADLAYFKQTTLGKPIIMGRDPHYSAEGAEIYPSLEDAITHACESEAEIFIIGGAQIYALALASDKATRIYATEVHTEIEGDAFFPEFDKQIWQEVSRLPQAPENNLSYDFVVYERQA